MKRFTSKTSETVYEDGVVKHPTNLEISATFIINIGTEKVYIEDELLTNYAVAEKRAISIFLDSSYTRKRLSFETYHIDGLLVGMFIEVDAVVYVIEQITDSIAGVKAKMKIVCERWE